MLSIGLHLHMTPKVGGVLLSASAGAATIWVFLCNFLAFDDLQKLQPCPKAEDDRLTNFQHRRKFPAVRTNSLAGFLGVASAITFTAANYPQPQTLSSFLVIIVAIFSSLGWIDVTTADGIVAKLVDVLTVFASAILVMDKASTYEGQWYWYHDPSFYCLIAAALEAFCAILGCWAVWAGSHLRESNPAIRQHTIAHVEAVIPTRILLSAVFTVAFASTGLCIRAIFGDIYPYTVGFGLVCSTFIGAMSLCLIIFAQSLKRHDH